MMTLDQLRYTDLGRAVFDKYLLNIDRFTAPEAIAKRQYVKSQLVRKIDFAWANYLESLEKVRQLVYAKGWLPQDSQEAFF